MCIGVKAKSKMDLNYRDEYKNLLTPEIVNCLCILHEYKGCQDYILEGNEADLDKMHAQSRLQSIASSNRMEGITAGESQMKKLAADKANPHEEKEKKIAGYRDAWMKIYRKNASLPFTPAAISELHRDLYRWFWIQGIGMFRKNDRLSQAESSRLGSDCHIFPFEEIPEKMYQLCEAFLESKKDGLDPLLLIPMAVLNFLQIRPFSEGNERMSRLLIHLLLVQNGYFMGRYCSIERRMEESRESYYELIAPAVTKGQYGFIDYVPFTLYLLKIFSDTCREFQDRALIMDDHELSKLNQVRKTIQNYEGIFTKARIAEKCTNVSEKTMQRAFEMLINSKEIIKIGGGRYTSYQWNGEK